MKMQARGRLTSLQTLVCPKGRGRVPGIVTRGVRGGGARGGSEYHRALKARHLDPVAFLISGRRERGEMRALDLCDYQRRIADERDHTEGRHSSTPSHGQG